MDGRSADGGVPWVVESFCPLCEARLRVHDGRACCPCCGDSYLAATNRLDVQRCVVHGRDCEHWGMIWRASIRLRAGVGAPLSTG